MTQTVFIPVHLFYLRKMCMCGENCWAQSSKWTHFKLYNHQEDQIRGSLLSFFTHPFPRLHSSRWLVVLVFLTISQPFFFFFFSLSGNCSCPQQEYLWLISCKEVSTWHRVLTLQFYSHKAEMPTLAIQKAVKGKLLKVEVAMLANSAVLL